MKKQLIAFFLAGMLMVTACAEAKWQEYSYPEGRFAISMADEPALQTQKVPSPIGDLTLNMYTLASGDKAYVVGYSDYPEAAVKQSDPKAILQGAQGGAVGNVNGTLISEKEIKIGNYPGREFVAEGKSNSSGDTNLPETGAVKGRVYLVNNRLYQTFVITRKENIDDPEIDQFLDSFKLTQ